VLTASVGTPVQLFATLSTKAEYISICSTRQHLAWLRSFFEDISHKQTLPTNLYNNNQGTIALSKDPQFQACTKHIQWKYHFVCDNLMNKNQALIKYIPTSNMVANIMTKPLPSLGIAIGSLLTLWDYTWGQVEVSGLRIKLATSLLCPNSPLHPLSLFLSRDLFILVCSSL
jgi:hypothetical protein